MRGENGTAALLGREREQAELYVALSLALKGEPQTVLVGGDAGIGKTTLVADLARRAEELGFSVALGHCLDIDAGVAFGAVIEAVGGLVARLEDLDSRPCARRMRGLLDPETPRSPEPFRVLEDLRQTVLEAADAGPVLLVVEDMHWAGRSTQDFAVALSRRGRGRLLFVLTVRNEDLHRRHPARRALAEISRVPGARRVDLKPLDRDGIAGIVAASSGVLRTRPSSARCWPDRKATRSTPRSSCPRTWMRSPSTCPTCSWPGSIPWPRGRVSCSGWRRWTGLAWTSRRSRELAGRGDAAAGRVPPRAARREPPEGRRRLPCVPARAAARGRLRRPAPRRAHPPPC